MSEPFELRASDLLTLGPIGGTVSSSKGAVASAGTLLWARFGQVFYYCNYGGSVIYVVVDPKPEHSAKRGRVYAQSAFQFGKELTYSAADQLSVSLAATKRVMEAWLDLYLGSMACVGGPTGWAIKGFQGLITAGKVYQNFDVYKKAVEVLLYNRDIFESRSPNLYGYVLAEILYGHLKQLLVGKVKDKVATGLAGPIAGKFVGVFMEKIGEDQFKLALKTINGLFKEVLIKVAQHTYDNPTAKLSASQIELLGGHVNKQLAPLGRSLPSSITGKIVTEAAYANIRSSMIKISAALDTL